MDKLRALRYFHTVAETSSFSSTAKRFGVPVSSVSRRVRDLESALGAELFKRSTRVVQLTELGELYLHETQAAVLALDHADHLVGQDAGADAGIVRISTMPGYGSVCLLPAIERLRCVHPHIIIDLQLTDEVTDLSRQETDIAIRASAVLPERAVAKRVSGNQFVMLASPGYLARNGHPRTLEQLLQHDTLKYRAPHGILHWQAQGTQGDQQWQELQTNAVFISNDGRALVNAALDGHGIALIPEWGARQELDEGRLARLELDDAFVSVTRAPDPSIHLVYYRPKYSLKKVKLVVDFLVAELVGQDSSRASMAPLL